MSNSYDLYASLGLSRFQSPEQLAAELDHRLSGVTRDTPEWHELSAARVVLGDATRRQMYDQRLDDATQTVTPGEIQQLAATPVPTAAPSASTGGGLTGVIREHPKLSATVGGGGRGGGGGGGRAKAGRGWGVEPTPSAAPGGVGAGGPPPPPRGRGAPRPPAASADSGSSSDNGDSGDSPEVARAKESFSLKTFLNPGDLVQGTDDSGPWFNKVSDGPDFEFTIDNLRTNTDTDGSSLVCYDIAGRNLGTYEQSLDEKNGAVAPEEDMAARWATAISDQMGDSSHIKSVGHDSYFMKSKITGAARVDVGHSDIAAYNANTGENSTTTINGGSFTTSICAKLKDKAIDNDAFTGIVVTYPEHYGYTAVKDGFKLDFSY